MYEPATLDGKPVDSRETIRVLYMMENNEDAVSYGFRDLYKTFSKLLDEENPSEKRMNAILARLKKGTYKTLYAQGHRNLLRYRYALKYEDIEAQISALEELLLFADSSGIDENQIFEKNIVVRLRQSLVNAYIANQEYGNALYAHRELTEKHQGAGAIFDEAIAQINELRKSEGVVSTSIKFDESGAAELDLFKTGIAFNEVQGGINSLKLRCDRKFAQLEFDPEAEYQIPKSWGSCHLELLGDSGTTTTLLQF